MLSYLIPVLNDIFESWRISEIASSFLICKYTVLSCHKTDCHMTTLLDFWIFRIQIQVVNNALRFFSKGHIVYIENPIIFLWIIIPQLCKQRSEILLCFSSLCDQFERFIFCRIVAQSCYKNLGDLLPGDNTIFRRSRMASVPLKHDDSVLGGG